MHPTCPSFQRRQAKDRQAAREPAARAPRWLWMNLPRTSTAPARDPAGTGHAPATQALAEVIVTAEKIAEPIDATPAAITALSMTQLRDAGVFTVPDLASTVPDLQVHTAGADAYFGVTIRGISNLDYSGGANPAVAIYIDGVYVGLPSGVADEMYDLGSVEVLRGPQGTLYGRNSTGGNVNINTADPQPKFGAQADISYGNYADVMTHEMVNVPVSDTLAVRVAAFTHRNDGYFNTEGTTARNYAAADDFGARVTTLWTPTDSFDWRLSLDGFNINGTPWSSIETGSNGLPLDGRDPYHQPTHSDPEPASYIGSNAARSRMEWKPAAGLSLTYTMGYQHVYQDYYWSTTGQVGSPNGLEGYEQYGAISATEQSHELDLSYKSNRLRNVFGGSYFLDNSTTKGVGVYPIDSIDVLTTPLHGLKRSWGVFDEATYTLSDSVDLTAGVRDSHDSQGGGGFNETACLSAFYPSLTVQQAFALTPTMPGCFPAAVPSATGSWSKITWKGVLSYHLNPSTMTYASVATGYKQGGVQPGLPAAFPATYDPETVTNYEIGAKTRLLSDSLSLRVAAFDEEYKDIQVFQLVSANASLFLATTNAGAARINGTEIESQWNATTSDHVSGFFTYLHARYTHYVDAIDPRTEAVIPSLTGNPLPNAPDYTFRLQYSHTFSLPNGGTFTPQVSEYWQSDSYLTAIRVSSYAQEAYSKTDLLLRYMDPTGHWSVDVYSYNLENNAVRTGDYSGSGVVFTDFGPPRTYGLRVSYND